MTERLYYTDSTILEFDATVTARHERDGHTFVALDRSAFYPTSGGQPHDIGRLNGTGVLSVEERDSDVWHQLAPDTSSFGVGQSVHGVVDRARRRDHMQQHTGQHLLSAVFEDGWGWPTTSVHIGADACTLDLGGSAGAADAVTPDVLRDAEQRANDLVCENRPVHVTFEDAANAHNLRKASERTGTLRIVTINNLDRSACGGTHVNATGEIGPILIRRAERSRGTVRVEFRCGQRAVNRARADQELLLQTAQLFTAAADDVPTLVRAMQEQLRAADKERSRLSQQLAGYEARTLHDAIEPDAQNRRVHRVHIARGAVRDWQPLAQAFCALGNAVFVGTSAEPPALLIAAAADTGLDCGRALREALHAVGGRGGGTPQLAQGTVPSADQIPAVLQHLELG